MNYVKIDDLKTHPDLQVRVRMNEEMIEDQRKFIGRTWM